MFIICDWLMGVVVFNYVLTYFFSPGFVHSERAYWSLQLYQWVHLFLLTVLPVFASCILMLYFYSHILRTVMSSWKSDPFIIISCLSLSLITSLTLKSALTKINAAIPAFFWLVVAWYIFLHQFNFNLYLSSYLKWIPCRKHIVGSWFLIHFDNICPNWCIYTMPF